MDAAPQNQSPPLTRPALVRLPPLSTGFWIATVLAAGMGETTSDFLFLHLSHAITLVIGVAGFTAALVLQFRSRRHAPWIYWFTLAMASVFGTMAADVASYGLGLPHAVSAAFFAVALTAILAWWYATEKTLSIGSINTPRRERFYWAAMVAIFAFGTEVGDLAAETLHLGFFSAGVLFAIVIAVPLAARRWSRLNAVVAFWFACIAARPLGASFADWLALPRSTGALGLGTGPIALTLIIAVTGLAGYLNVVDQ
jgi:uncharacterized membrane-anchored protein